LWDYFLQLVQAMPLWGIGVAHKVMEDWRVDPFCLMPSLDGALPQMYCKELRFKQIK